MTRKLRWYEPIIYAAILAVLLSSSCASWYLGETVATFETPEGLKGAYRSNKNQESFSAKTTLGPDGKINGVDGLPPQLPKRP